MTLFVILIIFDTVDRTSFFIFLQSDFIKMSWHISDHKLVNDFETTSEEIKPSFFIKKLKECMTMQASFQSIFVPNQRQGCIIETVRRVEVDRAGGSCCH